jgi:hypothetical protein
VNRRGLSAVWAAFLGLIEDRAMLSYRDKWKIVVWTLFHDRVLTPADRDTLIALAGYAVTGTAWPSQATLAKRVRCCAKTVQRALATARDLGMIDWQPGGRWLENGRWKRRSNRYWLKIPAMPIARADRPLRGQFAHRVGVKEVRKRAEPYRSVEEQLASLAPMIAEERRQRRSGSAYVESTYAP